MALRLAERSRLIEPSATLAMAAEAKRLKAAGQAVCDFSLGEPDFITPRHIQDAAFKAIHDGHTHYTPAAGIPELRKAIAAWYTERQGLESVPEQVIVSNGAKQSLHNALMATVGPGDEVIIPAPFWVSYADLVRLAGGEPVILPTTAAEGFKLAPDRFRAAVTPRTRLLMINSPSNPTGVVYSRAELEALADEVLRTDVGVISDEIYEQLTYEPATPTCFATLRPELPARTITISGVSKTYAMTGWRIGWAVGPPDISKFMGDVQSQETSNPCSISQWAALAAVSGPQDEVAIMRAEFRARRDLVMSRIAELPGVKCLTPDGAFYAFLDVSAHFGRTLGGRPVGNSTEFCLAALREAGVALVMGSAFGAEGYARMSFATDRATIGRGFEALADFLKG